MISTQEYYEKNGPFKGKYTIQPYYINKVNDTTFDISYVYTKTDNSDIGIDKRRFTFKYDEPNCNIIINIYN